MRLAPYPDTRIVTREESVEQRLPETDHATYCVGLLFDDAEFIHLPTDFRQVGLHRIAGYILGVEPAEEPPRLSFPDEGPLIAEPPIAEPYVCIATQGSTKIAHLQPLPE